MNASLIEFGFRASLLIRKSGWVMSSSERPPRLEFGRAADAKAAPRRSTGGLFLPDGTQNDAANGNQ
jgi:hypothetical protein